MKIDRAWDARDAVGAPSLVARMLLGIGQMMRKPRSAGAAEEEMSAGEKCSNFFRFFPHFEACAGETIVEIGGGYGELSAYLASRGAGCIWCVEPHPLRASKARERLSAFGNARLIQSGGREALDTIGSGVADRVILHDVMEHVADPLGVLAVARDLVSRDGSVYVMFMPWGAAFGGHTWSCLPIPWAHLFYPKSVLAELRSSVAGWHTTDLGQTGLYKIGVGKFLEYADQAGLRIEQLKLLGVKRQQWMTRVAVLREVGTALVAARLTSK